MTNYAQSERHDLADLFDEVGPQAPTLCGDWTTADLAAHLVVRERRPEGAIGILVRPFAGWSERVRMGTRDARAWSELVAQVRSGPPLALRPLDAPVNTVEYFVHHEDVRRADPAGWEPRPLDATEEKVIWARLALLGRVLARRSPVGVEVVAPGHGRATLHRAPAGSAGVAVSGPPSELLLFAFGRQAQARVDLDGDDVSVERLRQASLGL